VREGGLGWLPAVAPHAGRFGGAGGGGGQRRAHGDVRPGRRAADLGAGGAGSSDRLQPLPLLPGGAGPEGWSRRRRPHFAATTARSGEVWRVRPGSHAQPSRPARHTFRPTAKRPAKCGASMTRRQRSAMPLDKPPGMETTGEPGDAGTPEGWHTA
jgi:hypothetical protein